MAADQPMMSWLLYSSLKSEMPYLRFSRLLMPSFIIVQTANAYTSELLSHTTQASVPLVVCSVRRHWSCKCIVVKTHSHCNHLELAVVCKKSPRTRACVPLSFRGFAISNQITSPWLWVCALSYDNTLSRAALWFFTNRISDSVFWF